MKNSPRRRRRDTEDRITNLPDGIINHILSLLSTKDAILTSATSTKWKSIWASLSTLEVSEWDFYPRGGAWYNEDKRAEAYRKFLTFVYQVLVGGDMPYLEKVAIKGSDIHPSHIESWINVAIDRNIRELDLSFKDCYVDPPHEFPQILFSCGSLVVLRLIGLGIVINFPTESTCFPNLKVLQLESVLYEDNDSARNLFSGCPVLEDLTIVREEWDGLETLTIASGSLKSLSMEIILEKREDIVQKVVIDCPALESLDVVDTVSQDFEVKDLSSIIKAKLYLSNINSSCACCHGHYHECLFKLFAKMSSIKSLSLSTSTMLSLSCAISYKLPTFRNLTCLELFTPSVARDIVCKWKLMREILNNCPILEVLIFKEFSVSWREEFGAEEWATVPNCLVSHLKTIKIIDVRWEDKLETFKYFLMNSKVLEKMAIQTYLKQEFTMMRVAEEFEDIPRGSTTCQLEIC